MILSPYLNSTSIQSKKNICKFNTSFIKSDNQKCIYIDLQSRTFYSYTSIPLVLIRKLLLLFEIGDPIKPHNNPGDKLATISKLFLHLIYHLGRQFIICLQKWTRQRKFLWNLWRMTQVKNWHTHFYKERKSHVAQILDKEPKKLDLSLLCILDKKFPIFTLFYGHIISRLEKFFSFVIQVTTYRYKVRVSVISNNLLLKFYKCLKGLSLSKKIEILDLVFSLLKFFSISPETPCLFHNKWTCLITLTSFELLSKDIWLLLQQQ